MHCSKLPNNDNNNHKLKSPRKINKFFLCLNSPLVMDDDFVTNSKVGNDNSDHVLKFSDMEERKDGPAGFSRVHPSPVTESAGVNPKKKKSKRKFLGVFKAVLFETSLAKKIRKRSLLKKKKHSKEDTISKVDKDLNLVKEKLLNKKNNIDARKIIPSTNHSSVCSSVNNSNRFVDKGLSFRSFNNPNVESFRKKEEIIVQENGKGKYGSNTGLFLLLITLLVLVLWGKVLAILCTSTWLFFVPNWSSISNKKASKKNYSRVQSMDMEDYKKKIIMEGLLDRNRNRLP